MDINTYEIVDSGNVGCDDAEIKRKVNWKPFLRQMLVSSGIWSCYFTYGMMLGTPTVLVPYERRQANSTEAVSKEMASWLSAIFGIISIPWAIALPIIVKIYGRKKPFIFVSCNTIIGIIIFLTSHSMTQVLISEMFQGVLVAFTVTIGYLILTEYVSPNYRGIFLTIKSAGFFWGIWVGNAIGTFFHWKNMGYIALMCMIYNLVTVFFWCESPYWLARSERFEDCKKAYYWLHGSSQQSQEELRTIISDQRADSRKVNPRQMLTIKYVTAVFKTLILKEIYKPLFINLVVVALYFVSGKLVCSVYVIDIFKKISGEDSAYKGMLILDGVTVLAMYIGSGFCKIMKRRTLLFGATSVGIFFLFVISLYLYCIKLGIIVENKYVSLALLSGYSLSICCGPMILSTSIAAELLPLKARSSSVCLSAIGLQLTMTTFMKLAPYIFDLCGMHGTFLFYGIGSSICLYILYLYLPETKDKTIQQIMDAINGKKVDENNEMQELITVNMINTEKSNSIKP